MLAFRVSELSTAQSTTASLDLCPSQAPNQISIRVGFYYIQRCAKQALEGRRVHTSSRSVAQRGSGDTPGTADPSLTRSSRKRTCRTRLNGDVMHSLHMTASSLWPVRALAGIRLNEWPFPRLRGIDSRIQQRGCCRQPKRFRPVRRDAYFRPSSLRYSGVGTRTVGLYREHSQR